MVSSWHHTETEFIGPFCHIQVEEPKAVLTLVHSNLDTFVEAIPTKYAEDGLVVSSFSGVFSYILYKLWHWIVLVHIDFDQHLEIFVLDIPKS